jgi:hypothetical protein
MIKIVHFLAAIGIIGILASLTMVTPQAEAQQGCTQPGLNAQYYALSDPNTILISRIDPQIAFTYNGWEQPNNGIAETFNYNPRLTYPSGDPYAASWSGYLEIPETGTYTFGGYTDDFGSAQLLIGGQTVDIVPLHSTWKIAAHTDRDHRGGYDMYDSVSINLTKGFYPITAQLQENDGLYGAGFDLDWKRPGQQREVIPEQFLCAELPPTPTPTPIPVGSGGCGNWYIYLIIGLVLAAILLAFLLIRRFARPKVVADFKVEDISNGQMLICNIWNVTSRRVDDLIAYFEILGRTDMQRIGKSVRAKITTRQGEMAERIALPASPDPAWFPVVVFNQEINAAYIVNDSEEHMLLLPVGLYIISVNIYCGRRGQQLKQVSLEFTIASESPHIILSPFDRIDRDMSRSSGR